MKYLDEKGILILTNKIKEFISHNTITNKDYDGWFDSFNNYDSNGNVRKNKCTIEIKRSTTYVPTMITYCGFYDIFVDGVVQPLYRYKGRTDEGKEEGESSRENHDPRSLYVKIPDNIDIIDIKCQIVFTEYYSWLTPTLFIYSEELANCKINNISRNIKLNIEFYIDPSDLDNYYKKYTKTDRMYALGIEGYYTEDDSDITEGCDNYDDINTAANMRVSILGRHDTDFYKVENWNSICTAFKVENDRIVTNYIDKVNIQFYPVVIHNQYNINYGILKEAKPGTYNTFVMHKRINI